MKIGVSKSDDKEIPQVIVDVSWTAKQLQKYECQHKNHTRAPRKPDYSTSNTSMKDFTPGFSHRHY